MIRLVNIKVRLRPIIIFSIFISASQLIYANMPNSSTNVTVYNININGESIAKLATKAFDTFQNLVDQKKVASVMWFKNNRYALAGTGLAGLYIFIANKLTSGKITLYNNNNWTNWKNDISLQDLINKPTLALSQELHQSILSKYSNNNQNDLLLAIIIFNEHLSKELESLKLFVTIGNNLKKMKIKLLFLVSDKEIQQASEKINRLLYLKKIINESIKISDN